MKITYRTYLELPAPLAQAAALLGDPATWADRLGGAEAIGSLWRHGEELYQVDRRPAAPEAPGQPLAIGWTATPAGGRGPHVQLALTLHDALIATHVQVAIELEAPGPPWPWRRLQLGRAAAAWVRSAHQALEARLIARPVAAPALALVAAHGPAEGDAHDRPEPPRARGATPAQADLIEALHERYPQTVEQFVAMGALDHLERVARLEQGWEQIMRGAADARFHTVVDSPPTALDFDLIYAGGGLGLLHAALMAARYGRRVLVFDRGEVGCAHREWNISRAELQALVEDGLVSWDELDDVVMREYRDGLVRFHSGPSSDLRGRDLWLPEVLNVALDAGALLRLMRRKLEQAGGTVLSGRVFRGVRVRQGAPLSVEVELELAGQPGPIERFSARLLLDGMGSTSPLALLRHAGRPFAGVCPTVGTVAEGFAQGDGPQEYDPTLGDILVSVADAQGGEQLMWEGFPGRGDELTVYLFYYSTIQPERRQSYSLLELFEQYFTLLPSYKRQGPEFRQIKPVYGYIPARHSLRPQEAPLLRGVVPVGDSAAQQSPLTFCGFGSHVRNLSRTAGLLDYALRFDLLEPGQLAAVSAFQTNVSLNWVFSRFMHPWGQAHDVNRLQNLFLDVLHDLGVGAATRFFQDRMRWADYHPMILGVLRRYPRILLVSWNVLGPAGMLQWAGDYLRFSAAAAAAALARAGGPRAERGLSGLAGRAAPGLGLRIRARYAEWRAMGWL